VLVAGFIAPRHKVKVLSSEIPALPYTVSD